MIELEEKIIVTIEAMKGYKAEGDTEAVYSLERELWKDVLEELSKSNSIVDSQYLAQIALQTNNIIENK